MFYDDWMWYSWQVILLELNALIGLILFEWAWYKNRRWRKPIKELDCLLPAFRRTDAERWHKWMLYPGAMTLLIPRFLWGVLVVLVLCVFVKIGLIGQPMDEPIRGCRSCFVRCCYRVACFLFQFFSNFNFVTWKHLTMDDVNYYEDWLGPRDQ